MDRTEKCGVVEIASVFTSKIRVLILEMLIEGPQFVSAIVEELDLNQAVISKQLGILKDAGLVVCNPSGRCREYRISDEQVLKNIMDSFYKLRTICRKTLKEKSID